MFEVKKEHKERCCGKGKPLITQLAPVIVSTLKQGPYKKCPLCGIGNEFPFNMAMVINLLCVGVGSCAQYWEYGDKGWIENQLCSALQYFAHEPC